jgi:hypothetical protein
MDEIKVLRGKLEKIRSFIPEIEEFFVLTEKLYERYEMAAAAFSNNDRQGERKPYNTKTKRRFAWKENIIRFLEKNEKLNTVQLWQEFVKEGKAEKGPTDSSFRTILNLLKKRGEIVQTESPSGTKIWSLPTGKPTPIESEDDKIPWTENIFKFLKEKRSLTTKQLWENFLIAGVVDRNDSSKNFHANMRFALNNLRKKGYVKQIENPEGGRDLWVIAREYDR